MGYCGLRVSEALKLRADDLDFERSVLWVQGKGRDVHEPCKFFQEAQEPLKTLLFEKRLSFTSKEQLFKIKYATVEKEFRKSLERMGLDQNELARQKRKITIHSLRHTCGQMMLDRGNPLEIVQKQLRHRAIASTMVYAEKQIQDNFLAKVK